MFVCVPERLGVCVCFLGCSFGWLAGYVTVRLCVFDCLCVLFVSLLGCSFVVRLFACLLACLFVCGCWFDCVLSYSPLFVWQSVWTCDLIPEFGWWVDLLVSCQFVCVCLLGSVFACLDWLVVCPIECVCCLCC